VPSKIGPKVPVKSPSSNVPNAEPTHVMYIGTYLAYRDSWKAGLVCPVLVDELPVPTEINNMGRQAGREAGTQTLTLTHRQPHAQAGALQKKPPLSLSTTKTLHIYVLIILQLQSVCLICLIYKSLELVPYL
jgi:hypothetical protein